MITFNELRFSDDRDRIIISLLIDNLGAFSGMYINTVELCEWSNMSSTGEMLDSERVLRIDVGEGKREFASSIPASAFNLDSFAGKLFYVKVSCDGECEIETPNLSELCVDYGVVLDKNMLYDNGMALFRSHNDRKCDSGEGMKHFIVLWFALKLAIEACDFKEINKMWTRVRRFMVSNDVCCQSNVCKSCKA